MTLVLNPVFEAALEIARSREQILAKLREALERGDDAEALKVARQLVGIGPKGGNL